MDSPELRQDVVTSDWVLIAPARVKRSHKKLVRSSSRRGVSVASCPLEDLVAASGGFIPLLQYGKGKKWRLGVIENKFPAVSHREACPVPFADGPYQRREAVGRHELLITRNHTKNLTDLSLYRAVEIFQAFIERTRTLAQDHCLEYVSIFQNFGLSAGGSQPHPHYQLIAVPVIPPAVAHSMAGARVYHQAHHVCVHCVALKHERKARERLIYENKDALVFAPYASIDAFEFHVFPKRHAAQLETSTPSALAGVVSALQAGLRAMKKSLGDPDYNLFIHTAPLKSRPGDASVYHWHIEVFPKTNELAGFELSTGMVINPVAPEYAAQLLRKAL